MLIEVWNEKFIKYRPLLTSCFCNETMTRYGILPVVCTPKQTLLFTESCSNSWLCVKATMLLENLGITALQALLWLLVTVVVWCIVRLYNVRSKMLAFQRQGLVRNIDALEFVLLADCRAGNAPISSHLWSSIVVTELPGLAANGCTWTLSPRLD